MVRFILWVYQYYIVDAVCYIKICMSQLFIVGEIELRALSERLELGGESFVKAKRPATDARAALTCIGNYYHMKLQPPRKY